MRTISFRQFYLSARVRRAVRSGEPVLVTDRGRPYFVAMPPKKRETFVGAARAGKPLRAGFLRAALAKHEWGGLA